MLRRGVLLLTLISLSIAMPRSAFAYVGPGAGITVIGAALAFIAAAVFGVFGFIWYPLKRLVRALSRKRQAGSDAADT
jgi:hypothetical protein